MSVNILTTIFSDVDSFLEYIYALFAHLVSGMGVHLQSGSDITVPKSRLIILYVWDKLPTENVRIYRVLTSDGDLLIGRVVPENMIDATLYKLGATREKENIPTEDLLKSVKNGDTAHLDNGWRIMQRKVSNEQRIEIMGADYLNSDLLAKKGVFTERIAYQTR